MDADIDAKQLLAEIEDVLRTMPALETIRHNNPENLSWIGRAAAAIENWNSTKGPQLQTHLRTFQGLGAREARSALMGILALLQQARHDLRMKTGASVNAAFGEGMVFDYFDDVRRIVESAKQDILFIDPYLDAEFVSRYLGNVTNGVTVRLLARERLASLLPATDAFAKQHNASIEIRSAPNFHDRYVIVDRTSCYQSGASFKDGAKKAPTTLTQITDAFSAVAQTYEGIWTKGKIERTP